MWSFVTFLILVFYVFMLCIREQIYTCNVDKHLRADSDYGHFSKIDNGNRWLFPRSWFTRPDYVVDLTDGQSLVIPKGWWHKVTTHGCTWAYNLWTDAPLGPVKLHRPSALPLVAFQGLLCQFAEKPMAVVTGNPPIITTMTLKEFQALPGHVVAYLMSLEKYNYFDTNVSNVAMKQTFQANVLPEIMKSLSLTDVKVEGNLWLANGPQSTTGLHYDDNNGILTVLQGRKTVELYHPSKGRHLSPHSLLPNWVNASRLRIQANVHTIQEALYPSRDYSNSHLFYDFLRLGNAPPKYYKLIDDLVSCLGYNKLVWGCKTTPMGLRWELYIYAHSPTIERKDVSHFLSICKAPADIIEHWSKDAATIDVISYDLDPRPSIKAGFHFYYRHPNQLSYELPYHGTCLDTQSSLLEADFIIDESINFQLNYRRHLATLKLEHYQDVYDPLKYGTCSQLCIFNKWPTTNKQLLAQYLGVTFPVYQTFVATHFGINLPNGYKDLCHELTELIDENGNIIRAAIYSCF
jgi:hypothetical protein